MTHQDNPPFVFEDFLSVFTEVVSNYPDNLAVIEEGQRKYTYRQLDADSRKLAAHLAAQGLSKELAAVIAIPKSYRYLVALLAIWRAGGAFVPVDSALPEERLRSIFSEISTHNNSVETAKETVATSSTPMATASSTLLILCDQEHKTHLQSSANGGDFSLHFVDWFGDADALPKESAQLDPGDLAYIIFTSGSTGRPKGVMVEHRGIVNLLKEQIAAFEITSETRSLFYLSTSFDAAVSDLGTALLAGATLLIERPENLRPDAGLMKLITDRQVSYVDIPPSVLSLLNADEKPDCLKSMVIGGEVCPKEVVRSWAEKLRLVCVYGPTEATVCTSWSLCDGDWDAPLIGRPIANIQYCIMDEGGQKSLPLGLSGELCISGVGLCRGYLNRDEFNRERFFTLAEKNGKSKTRYYRTRDRITSLPDGNFEFVGRVDRQMKLRGMLIEPEEVEAALTAHPDIARACVLKGKLPGGRDVLLAYLTSKTGNKPSSSSLRKYLGTLLPAWMLPQRLIYLDAIPETISGKPDMKALVELYDTESKSKSSASSNPSGGAAADKGTAIAQALCQILGYEEIDSTENFFDLGLDSLSTIELAATLNRVGIDMAPEAIFKHPTVQRLAKYLESAKDQRESTKNDYSNAAVLLRELEADKRIQSLKRAIAELSVDSKEIHSSPSSLPQTVLLTGATGFLGSRLLVELLKSTDSYKTIYALVRAASEEEASERISMTALKCLPFEAKQRILKAMKERRIILLPGDVSKDNLGLSAAVYKRLSTEVDQVLHLAATVNMILPFEKLKAVNFDGTLNIAEFAFNSKIKSLHYASTLSVFVSTDKNHGVLKESDRLEDTKEIYGGYAQTKWLAEKALLELQDAGAPISIYRLGLITGDTTSGITADTDFLSMFVRGIREMGAIPAECLSEQAKDILVDITPVDYAAAAMGQILRADNLDGDLKVYHIANPQGLSLSRFAQTISKLCPNLQSKRLEELYDATQWQKSTSASAAYLGLCRLFDKDQIGTSSGYSQLRVMDLFQATDVTFHQENTLARLSNIRLTCPEASDTLIELYVKTALAATGPYLFSDEPWKLNPPADESQLASLMKRIEGFPRCLADFLREHDGGEGGVKNTSKISGLILYGVKDLSYYFDYFNERCFENWKDYLIIGMSGAGHELLLPLHQDDPAVYACDPLDDEPVSEMINLLFPSFSTLLDCRTLR